MPQNKKITALVIFGILIAALAIFLPEQEDIAFEVVVNNTELCQYNHTLSRCTGERNTSTTYYANDSAIQIFLMAHANTVGANASIQLYINGTQVEHTSGRPLGAAEDNYKSISAIIPKGSNYSATFMNYHHYEWREYPILTGRNSTLSINQTVIQQGTGSQNLSQVLGQGNNAGAYNIDMNGKNIQNLNSIIVNSGFNQVYTAYDATVPTLRSRVYDGSISNYIEQFLTYTAFSKSITVDGNITMNGNLIGCTNCINNLSQVLTQGNDAQGKNIESLKNLNMTGKLLLDSSYIADGTTLDLNYSRETRYNGTTRSFQYYKYGIEEWKVNDAFNDKGIIAYTTPGATSPYTASGGTGIAFYNPARTNNNLTRIISYDEGFILNVYNSTGVQTSVIFINRTSGNVTISKLAGTGNAYTCSASDGTQYRGNPGC